MQVISKAFSRMKYLLFKEPQFLNNFALKTQEFLFQKQTSNITLVLLLPFTTTHRADGRVSGMPCCQHEFSLVESFQSDEEPANESPFINHVPIEPHHTKHPNKTKNKQFLPQKTDRVPEQRAWCT